MYVFYPRPPTLCLFTGQWIPGMPWASPTPQSGEQRAATSLSAKQHPSRSKEKDWIRISNYYFWQAVFRISTKYIRIRITVAAILSAKQQCGSGQQMDGTGSGTILNCNHLCGSMQNYRIRICNHAFWQIELRITTERTVAVFATILYGKYHCGSLQKGP